MKQHTVTVQEDEFRLLQSLRQINRGEEMKKALIDKLVQQIQDFLTSSPSQKQAITWLQEGDLRHFRQFDAVRPKPGSPLASDIIIAQREQER